MEDEMILPDGFEGTPTAEPEVETQDLESFTEETAEAGEDTTPPVETVETVEPTPQKLKLTYNGQEMEVDTQEAAILAQKGMNYEKAVERARAEAAQVARDTLIADMGYTWNGVPITNEAQYKQALAEQELINKYKDRDLPEEVIKELVESKRDREERLREKQQREEESKLQAAYNEFFDYFESVNERRFDSEKDVLPQEVIDAVNKGKPLMYAYMEHHNRELRNQLKISKQNAANTKKAPVGSLTANGGTKTESVDPFLAGFNSLD